MTNPLCKSDLQVQMRLFTPSASNNFKTFAYSPRELSASNIKNNLKNKGVLQDPAQDNVGLEDSNDQVILKDREHQKGVRDIPKDPDRDDLIRDPAQDNVGL